MCLLQHSKFLAYFVERFQFGFFRCVTVKTSFAIISTAKDWYNVYIFVSLVTNRCIVYRRKMAAICSWNRRGTNKGIALAFGAFSPTKMTDILCRWLNEDVRLSRIIGKLTDFDFLRTYAIFCWWFSSVAWNVSPAGSVPLFMNSDLIVSFEFFFFQV